MKHFINLKDIPAKDLRKILIDAKKRKNARKKLNNLEIDKSEIVDIVSDVEHNYIGLKGGIMDHKSHRDNSVKTVLIGEEKRFNPRLQVSSSQEYASIMENLNLSNPKMMDIAVPANKKMGLGIKKQKILNGITFEKLLSLSIKENSILIDLR